MTTDLNAVIESAELQINVQITESGPPGPAGPAYDDTEIKEDLSQLEQTKVGYSEVVNGQLLMYSDATKEHLLATLDLPSGGGVDVQINGTSITQDGVANIPFGSETKIGVVRCANNVFTNSATAMLGCYRRTTAQFSADSDSSFIGKGTLNNVLATPSIMPALTAEEQAAAQQRLGILSVEEVLF